MEHSPNRSAQEAALSAVNLASAAEPSDDAPALQSSQAESLSISYGLLILERSPDGIPTWLACKFCPIFGCKKKHQNYLKLYTTPFNKSPIQNHIKADHPEQWAQFKDLDEQSKKDFFKDKTLPSTQTFRARMESLKKIWNQEKLTKAAKQKRKRSAVGAAEVATAATTGAKRLKVERGRSYPVVPLGLLPLLSHREDWIGRMSFEASVRKTHKSTISQTVEALNSAANGVPRRCAALPGNNLYQHLRNILQRHSEPFSRYLDYVVNHPLVIQNEIQGDVIPPVWNEIHNADIAARALFYQLRGIPVDVATTLLEESNHGEEAQRVDKLEKPIPSKKLHVDVSENKEEAHPTEKAEDIVMVNEVEDLDATNHSKQADELETPKDLYTSETPQDWKKVVSATADCVGNASMLALKRILSARQSWTFVITTRPCPVRKDAVEVLIPVPQATIANTTMLTALRPFAVPVSELGDDTIASSSSALNGTGVGNNTGIPSDVPTMMGKRVATLVSLIFTTWLLQNETRPEPPDGGDEGMNIWIRECVNMCLKGARDYLKSSDGITKAEDELKTILDNQPVHTDWLIASPPDDATIERARENYALWEPSLRDSEWQAEKQVCQGLAICYQKAVALTPCTDKYAPLKYAKAIVKTAITFFDIFMPDTIAISPLSFDPLHLVSVREGDRAAETVIRLLDVVYPQWPSRLIGIRSMIAEDAVAKELEKRLVNALQERRMDELKVVDESIPDEDRPIYPSTLANMTPENFRKLLDTYIKEPAYFLGGAVEMLMRQHGILSQKENGTDRLKKSWKEYEDLKHLMTFVRGLELLWRREPDWHRKDACRFSGVVCDDDKSDIVDRGVEHVFRARTLMQIEQMEKVGQKVSPQQTSFALKDWLIRWGDNWSNLLTGHTR